MPLLDYSSATLALSTSVGAPRHHQTDTSIFSVWACHTDASRPSLAAVWWAVSTVISSWLCLFTDACIVCHHVTLLCCWLQSSPSPVAVILSASAPTYTAFHSRWSCVTFWWLEQSVTWCHLSSNAHCFSELPQNLTFFYNHFLPNCFQFLVLYTLYMYSI